MDINKKLEEVSNYFKQKVIKGDFEFKKCDKQTATILINGKYEFDVWIANDPKTSFDFYDGNLFINNNLFPSFDTQKERLAGWRKIKPYVEEYKEKQLKRQKQKEINRLTKELEELKK